MAILADFNSQEALGFLWRLKATVSAMVFMKPFTEYLSPFGPLLLTSDGERLTGLYFSGQKRLVALQPDWQPTPQLPLFEQARREIAGYCLGRRRSFDLALAITGTPFERRVWEAIAQIPYGSTMSYQTLATAIGHPQAARAVGAATARNPIAIVIPCHRVLGASGALTGYAGGLQRKRALLELERTVLDTATR